MKRLICFIIIFFIVWFLTLRANAPPPIYGVIPEAEAIHPYGITDHTLLAFVWLESRFEENAVNKVTKARGILQITPKMIKEVNTILKKYKINWLRYTWKDAWDPIKSIDIWYIVQTYHNPDYDIQKACRIWFGTGKQYDGMTWKNYYKIITNYMLNK